MSGRGVAITGIGVVHGSDCGVDALTASLCRPRMTTMAVDDRHGYHAPGTARRAILSRTVDLTPWLAPAAARRMSPPSRLAVAAARMAAADAGLESIGGTRTAVVLATSLGPVTSTEELLATARRDGPQAVSPFAFAESVANAAAGQVAIALKAQGPNITVVQREAGALTAIGRGTELISSGRADRVLVGCVDEMPPLLHAVMGRFDALAQPGREGHEIARPFDAGRTGFVAAEGAAVLVLERLADARGRGAALRGTIRAFGGGFDATSPRIGWGTGHAVLAAAVSKTMHRAGCEPADVDRIVSSASGSVAGDRLEGQVLRGVWDSRALPAVMAPKGHLGQYGGGFMAAAALSVRGGVFAPTAGFVSEDPALGIRPFGGGLLDAAELSLFITISSGGSASWVLAEAA